MEPPRLARNGPVPSDHTFRWIGWLLGSTAVALLLVVMHREIALWLPRVLGYRVT